MGFPKYSYGSYVVFLGIPTLLYSIPIMSLYIPMVFLWFSYGFSMVPKSNQNLYQIDTHLGVFAALVTKRDG